MKRIPVAGYIDQDGKSVITRYAEMTVDPRELAAAERAVVEAAVHWLDGTTTEELRPAVRELIRLRAAQESEMDERNLDK